MRRFAQSDFDSIQRDEKGWKHVPCGDWTEVDFRGEDNLVFEKDGECEDARFGDFATFGNYARFGDFATFGNYARFGDFATFGNYARFGDFATFGNYARFGEDARFGDDASFENEKVKNAAVFSVRNIGSRNGSAYAFCDTKTGKIFVRAGCWFGKIDDFVKHVKEVHGGADHETDYMAFVEFAKARFARCGKEQAE